MASPYPTPPPTPIPMADEDLESISTEELDWNDDEEIIITPRNLIVDLVQAANTYISRGWAIHQYCSRPQCLLCLARANNNKNPFA